MTTIDTSPEALEIERDETMAREYIPLPGGWEVQTKGGGSTLRLLDKKSGERHPMPLGESFMVEFFERFAREVNAACSAIAAEKRAGPGDTITAFLSGAKAMQAEAARIAEGWLQDEADENSYMTSGNGTFWDAGTNHDQGRAFAAADIRAIDPAALTGQPLAPVVDDGWNHDMSAAPRDGTRLLAMIDGVDRPVLTRWNGGEWETIDGNDWSGRAMTAWRHLPAPPATQEQVK